MKEFTMGARLQLKDNFSKVIRQAHSNTRQFQRAADQAADATKTWTDRNGRLRNELGQFVGQGKKAVHNMKDQARAADSLKDKVFSLRGAFTALAGSMALKAGYDWLVGANANMETYENTLTVVMKSNEKAKEALAWAETFSAKTPFEIPQVIEATTRLSAYGLEAQKVLGITGDMAAVMGKDLMQAVEAVADAQTGELERLKEFGITKKMVEEQAKLLGMNPINNKGQITNLEGFNAALFSLMEKRYKGGMEMQSKTFKGMVSNIKDFIGTAGRELGKPLFDKVKQDLSGLLNTLNRLRDSGALDDFVKRVHKVSGVISKTVGKWVRYSVGQVNYLLWRFREFYNENEEKVKAIKTGFINAFTALRDAAMPIILWLRYQGVGKLADGLEVLGTWVVDVASWFIKHWEPIKPFVTGLAIAWGTYKAVMVATNAVTKAVTAAQWAFNVALNANPIGLVITAIGLLIGAGILLYKNFDTVAYKAKYLWAGIKDSFRGGVNYVIRLLNKMIEGMNNAFNIQLPDWLGGKEFKLNIPKIDELGNGTSSKTAVMYEQYAAARMDGSHAKGLNRVPFDGYRAELHKDEAILNSRDANLWRNGVTPAGTSNTTNNKTDRSVSIGQIVLQDVGSKDPKQLVNELLDEFYKMIDEADEVISTGDRGALLNA